MSFFEHAFWQILAYELLNIFNSLFLCFSLSEYLKDIFFWNHSFPLGKSFNNIIHPWFVKALHSICYKEIIVAYFWPKFTTVPPAPFMIHVTYKFYLHNTDTCTETPSCTDTETALVLVLLTVPVRLTFPPCTDTETHTDTERPLFLRIPRP